MGRGTPGVSRTGNSVADLHSKILDARPPPLGVQILSISCSFWENLAKSYVGAPSEELAPPPRINPGSATGNRCYEHYRIYLFFDKTISKKVKWRSWIHPNFACQGNSFICTKSHYHLTLVYLGMDLEDAGEVHFFYFHAVSG